MRELGEVCQLSAKLSPNEIFVTKVPVLDLNFQMLKSPWCAPKGCGHAGHNLGFMLGVLLP